MIRIAPQLPKFDIAKSAASSMLLIMSIAALAGCTSGAQLSHIENSRNDGAAPVAESLGTLIADRALELVGIPYRYGGQSPDAGFDCSGLVYFTYRQAGVDVPRVSADQFKISRKISYKDIRDGDLVFFQDQSKLSHVGIYVGDGMFIHAPSSGKSVSLADMSAPYYQRHLIAVGRLLPD